MAIMLPELKCPPFGATWSRKCAWANPNAAPAPLQLSHVPALHTPASPLLTPLDTRLLNRPKPHLPSSPPHTVSPRSTPRPHPGHPVTQASGVLVGEVVDVYSGMGTHDTLRVKLRANEDDIRNSRLRWGGRETRGLRCRVRKWGCTSPCPRLLLPLRLLFLYRLRGPATGRTPTLPCGPHAAQFEWPIKAIIDVALPPHLFQVVHLSASAHAPETALTTSHRLPGFTFVQPAAPHWHYATC